MPRTLKLSNSLSELLNESARPIYAIDGRRRIVYCNAALAAWLELEPARVIGRLVEYHSEPVGEVAAKSELPAPLTDLCPPPRALAGEACVGTISCILRDGRLSHRHAEFFPLSSTEGNSRGKSGGGGVLVLLAEHELSPEQLAAEAAADPSADELHRSIRRFRRSQASHYSIESLVGDSPVMHKVRAQVATATASGANVLIVGRPGSGCGHLARAIHYRTAGEAAARLVPVDCEIANDDSLRRAMDALRSPSDDPRHRPTLLLEKVDRLQPSHQSQLLSAIRHNTFRARVIATCSRHTPSAVAAPLESDPEQNGANTGDAGGTRPAASADERSVPATLDAALLHAISTITIHLPRLTDRIEDLPVLAHLFLEASNRGTGRQVGSLRADALDQLALYAWPGELNELRDVIASAHAACTSHEITPGDLPAVIHHASQTASRSRRRSEKIVLDELLAQIEREAIVRALAEAGGNKTGAAELLGLTRPRLYRRMVQLGLASESKDTEQLPEFIERPPGDEAP